MTDQQEPSHRLGKYEVLEEIGKGGFATVYRARDSVLGREVALKVLAPQLLDDEVWEARFFKEARAVARLEHPHIATIYEIAEEEGRLFIAMQLVRGGSLADCIARDGPVPWEQTLNIVTQVADALDYAHGEGVFHRDLKPANVLLDARRGAVLTDFGFASIVGEHSMSLSLSGGLVGTPNYIAPEIWEGKAATAQTDLYAMGCILYEMVTADKAFPGDTPVAVMWAHHKPLALPETWPPGVPSGVEAILRQALAGEPEERYPNPAVLAAALEEGVVKVKAEAKVEIGMQAEVLEGPPTHPAAEAGQGLVWQQIGIEMVPIPAGEFLYGDDKERVYLPEYFLARTPVTNAQYRAFVEAMGYRMPDHWENGEIPVGKQDHPVVRVSWEDSLEFCVWAGCRLPTEQEWEKGARGTDGREYPWGDGWEAGHCNTMEAGIKDTTPVDRYPPGASPYGLLDMAGNVWEWCQDRYDEERKYKVVRGGSWCYLHYRARCANRFRVNPGYAYGSDGFRCGVS